MKSKMSKSEDTMLEASAAAAAEAENTPCSQTERDIQVCHQTLFYTI